MQEVGRLVVDLPLSTLWPDTRAGEYVEQADWSVFVGVMIETVETMKGLDSIILVPFDHR